MINCLVIDDEPLARECIIEYVHKVDFLNYCGAAANPTQIHTLSSNASIDLLFLDIQMPEMSGLDYLKNTNKRPMTILTTAYPSYALEGFELDVLDYLVKPITFKRFYKAAVKAQDYYQLLKPTTKQENSTPSYFFIKCDQVYERIYFDQIEFVQAMQNYVVIHTAVSKYMTLIPLKRVLELLPKAGFIQTHKSYLVAINKIQTLEKTRIKLTKDTVPLSRNFKEQVHRVVMQSTLFKK